MTTERERMLAGAPYRPGDPELAAIRAKAQRLMRAYNATTVSDRDLRAPLLREMLAGIGPDTDVRAPFYVDYGCHITLGRDVFLNYGCVLLDVCEISIGDGTQLGPMTQLLAADHPRDPAMRAEGLETGKPVHVGRNVWIGAAALVLPGVAIGDDAIIGAGAVVTGDVPAGGTAVGNPARVLQAAHAKQGA